MTNAWCRRLLYSLDHVSVVMLRARVMTGGLHPLRSHLLPLRRWRRGAGQLLGWLA